MDVLDIIKMEVKAFRYMTCYMEPEGDILFAHFHKNIIVDLEMAKEIVANRLAFTENKHHYLVMEFSNIHKVTNQAVKYMQLPEGGLKNIQGAAFIVSNPLSLLIANIFIKTPKEFPAKFFTSEKNAVRWIKELKKHGEINASKHLLN